MNNEIISKEFEGWYLPGISASTITLGATIRRSNCNSQTSLYSSSGKPMIWVMRSAKFAVYVETSTVVLSIEIFSVKEGSLGSNPKPESLASKSYSYMRNPAST